MKKKILLFAGIFLVLILVGFFIFSPKVWYCYLDEYILGETQAQIDACYYDVAVYDENFSVCDRMEDLFYRSQCFFVASVTKEDVSFCEKIERRENREGARSVEKIENEAQISECYAKFAIETEDVSVCDEITGEDFEDLKNLCVAVVEKDISLCDEIESEVIRENCYYEISE